MAAYQISVLVVAGSSPVCFAFSFFFFFTLIFIVNLTVVFFSVTILTKFKELAESSLATTYG